jgi:lipoprotein-releasing system permease protein
LISTLEKEITFRFLKARKKDGFLNIISIFSFIGISLGVAVLIIVMSVMNGFRSELINKIVGFNSHITVKSYDNSGIDRNKLNNKNLKFITKNIIFSNSGEAIILKNNTSKGIVLRGYQTNLLKMELKLSLKKLSLFMFLDIQIEKILRICIIGLNQNV